MLTCFLPPKTTFSASSALIRVLFLLVLEIGGGSRFANKLDFIGDRRECPELYLLLWRLSVCLNL